MSSPSQTPPNPSSAGSGEAPTAEGAPQQPPASPSPGEGSSTEPDTFPRSYVEELRTESAGWRTKAQRADALAAALTTELARSHGKLADPTDLPFSDDLLGEDGLPSPEKIGTAVDALIAKKPHLADRRPTGSVDQGARGSAETFDFGSFLRTAAGG